MSLTNIVHSLFFKLATDFFLLYFMAQTWNA